MNKQIKALFILISVLILVCLLSMFIGSVLASPSDESGSRIIGQVRMPRIVLSALVGVLLATSGVILQGILRNPLADPFILGVSSGAGIGAAIALAIPITFTIFGMSSIPLFAFVFALAAVFVVYRLAYVKGRSSPETLILAGVAVAAFASAILSLIILVSGRLRPIYFWLLGSFSGTSWADVWNIIPYTVAGLVIAFLYSKELNALLLGEEIALTLGVEVENIRIWLILVASLMTAAAVSVSGLIGFVGLIIPHFVRLLIGPNHRWLIPFSALAGAILLVVADTLARTLFSPIEVPIGAIMSLVGAPFFLYILRTRTVGGKR
ncbi:MAG: iron chelate uptake ABC transporter family permease subunit [Candidatus Saganbacteria bacterium]|nr:iron chelate uptake ABC transporter family permease subunit [Candidatus Saganbacteria bacterium]